LADIAEAAAMMTQTDVERRYITGCWDYLPNRTVTDVIWETMQEVGDVSYSDDDRAFASDLKDTISREQVTASLEDVPAEFTEKIRGTSLYDAPIPPHAEGEAGGGSTEVGDVSWITPTGQFRAATWAVGTPAHTWQATAANGDFGKKGAVYAAKVLGGTAYTLINNPSIIKQAQEEFDEITGEQSYETPLPAGTEPPFDITGPHQ
jgi:aminobenzoyl-glutamate utilization protein B